jgi:hypothetical protein
MKGRIFPPFFMYVIQHCVICRTSDSTVSEDAGMEPRTAATLALTARRSNHSARSHPPPQKIEVRLHIVHCLGSKLLWEKKFKPVFSFVSLPFHHFSSFRRYNYIFQGQLCKGFFLFQKGFPFAGQSHEKWFFFHNLGFIQLKHFLCFLIASCFLLYLSVPKVLNYSLLWFENVYQF